MHKLFGKTGVGFGVCGGTKVGGFSGVGPGVGEITERPNGLYGQSG
jgi:hypothetical protein